MPSTKRAPERECRECILSKERNDALHKHSIRNIECSLESPLTYKCIAPYSEWVMPHTCMSRVTHMNEWCLTYKWVTSHNECMNESTLTNNESTLTNNEWVMPHIQMSHITQWMCHVTRMNESTLTNKWVTSLWMSYATHKHESCYTFQWVMPHIQVSHVTHTNESHLTYK